MSITDKHIVETYAAMLEGLNDQSKKKIMEGLSKSLKTEVKLKEDDFYTSFGAFASERSAEDIAADIKRSRKFRKKEINF